jgi:S1-C subfamily serine protease
LIQIEAENLVPFRISTNSAQIAEEIYAVGTPTAEDLGQSISRGIVSGVRSGDGGTKLIQTDASINGGNSGGAMINKQGEVLGVVQAKVKGFGVEGIAFGIPAEIVVEKLRLKF